MALSVFFVACALEVSETSKKAIADLKSKFEGAISQLPEKGQHQIN